MSKSIKDLSKDAQDTINTILARAAERRAAKNQAEEAKGA